MHDTMVTMSIYYVQSSWHAQDCQVASTICGWVACLYTKFILLNFPSRNLPPNVALMLLVLLLKIHDAERRSGVIWFKQGLLMSLTCN